MNSIDFCYWLQGYFEISGKNEITEEQAKIIKNHLNLVFKHEIDGMYEKDKLQEVHDGTQTSTAKPPHWLEPGNDTKIRC